MPEQPRTTDRSNAVSTTSRRRYLQAAGALGAASLTGSALVDGPLGQVDERRFGETSTQREDFLWMYGHMMENDQLRANLLAFARRHDLAVVVEIRSANFDAEEALFRQTLREATAAGLDVWIRVGMLTDVTANAFVTDPDARAAHLDRLRTVCRVYDDLTEDGRVVLWEEAPVMGQWVAGGAWNQTAIDNLREHGPRIYAEQRRVVEEATTDREVGIFVHFPYVVDSKSPEMFATLTDRLAQRGASPDFAFLDFYRGWYEKDAGPETADDAVRSLVGNATDALDGDPVFYLAQAHTVDPNHTPSKQSIRSNVRAALEAGADGLGWYDRTKYVPTEQGFDPYVPNVPDARFDDAPVGTSTVARDRVQYAWLSTLATRAEFDPDERFDLWLRGDDLSFYDHRVTARTGDGWEFLCDVDGYVDGEYPYASGADGDVSIVRALRRDRWINRDAVTLRIETADDAPETTLRGALAMPCNPGAYVAEHEAAARFAEDAPVEQFALGVSSGPVTLSPGESNQLTVPVRRRDPPSLHGLQHPNSLDAVRRLQAAESGEAFDPRGRFDLWVHGEGLSDPAAAPSIRGESETMDSPANASVVALGGDSLALYYGLERDRFLADGLSLADDGSPGTRVKTAYAMPHAGSATFRSPEEARVLLEEQRSEVVTYSITATRP